MEEAWGEGGGMVESRVRLRRNDNELFPRPVCVVCVCLKDGSTRLHFFRWARPDITVVVDWA